MSANDEPTRRTISGNKIIYADNFVVHGDINVGETATESAPLELMALKCDAGVLDIAIRNISSVSSLISKVELVISEITLQPDPAQYMRLPVTYQYNCLIDTEQSVYSIDVTQEIEGKRLDRFQVVFALGRMAEPEQKEGPWGYSLIFPPSMPGDGPPVRTADVKASVRFHYDNARVLEVPEVAFTLAPIGWGYKAKKSAGFSLEEKIGLLTDDDINVAESVIRLLADIGDPLALPALEQLAKSDIGYLRDHYSKTYAEVDPHYNDLPRPDRRLDDFKISLSNAIEHLTELKRTANIVPGSPPFSSASRSATAKAPAWPVKLLSRWRKSRG
jgi:hypothetical protein